MEGKKYLIYVSLITVLVLISSCAQVQDKDTKDTIIDASFGAISTYLGAEFELKVNQEAVINSENIRIKFLEILEDSRCPRDVQCIWAGQIKILVNIMKNNQDMGNFELAINPVKGDTKTQSFDKYFIELKEVKKSGYESKATLIIKKQEPIVIYSMGSGWTDYSSKITINKDGQVYYEEKIGYTDTSTIKTKKLSEGELKGLLDLIKNVDIFSYNEIYICKQDCPTDMPSQRIKFIINEKEKEISIIEPAVIPEDLEKILDKIKDIQKKFYDTTTTTILPKESIDIITDKDSYPQSGNAVEIKLKNNGLSPIILRANNGCAQFFKVIDLKTGKNMQLYDKNLICTMAIRELTINQGETKTIGYWDKIDYDNAYCNIEVCTKPKVNLGKYKIVVLDISKIVEIIA
ncbi:hypothetical protein J4214_02805 [Candidatus Woesearchaeota archaeon]|nr:hypothetical protein [Candidatus Woesearchaeota archaeon]